MRFGVLRLLLAVPVLACLAGRVIAAEPAAITNRMKLDYDVRADGQYTTTLHFERRADTDAAARSLAAFAWQYSPSHEQVEILGAFTRNADGSRAIGRSRDDSRSRT